MPGGLRQFAEYQLSPVADTVRGLLSNAAVGDHAIAAVTCSVSIALAACRDPLWRVAAGMARRPVSARQAAGPV